MHNDIIERIEQNPVIAAVRREDDLMAALSSIAKFCDDVRLPVIAGGLIDTKEDIIAIPRVRGQSASPQEKRPVAVVICPLVVLHLN